MAAAAILYHYPCPDGAFAALAAHLYFKATCLPSLFFPNTVYRPLTPHDLPLTQISHLYLLDFVGPPHFLQDISAKVQRVIVLDHHKTALEMLGSENLGAKNVDKVIDMERSGATIALDYFKEKLMNHDAVKHQYVLDEFERVRQLFRYIEDGDLWRWKLHNSKAFSSGLKDLNIEFDVRKNPSMFDQAVDADTTLSELRSELGHQLAMKSQKMKLRGIGAIVYKVPELENDHKFKISLRSVENEDTTPISQEFGGGGHRNASSFMLSCEEFEQWKV
ncbi:hypothetical protein AAHE18_05G226600 [Arachis hypogaea]